MEKNINNKLETLSEDQYTLNPPIPTPIIKTKLSLETWLWEKEQNHRLFNFHEGFRIYDESLNIIGSNYLLKMGKSAVKL